MVSTVIFWTKLICWHKNYSVKQGYVVSRLKSSLQRFYGVWSSRTGWLLRNIFTGTVYPSRAFRLTSGFYCGFVLGISLALCVMLVFVLWFPPHVACVSVLPIFYCAFCFLQHLFIVDHDYRQSFSTNNTTGVTSWVVTAFHSGGPEINPCFSGVRDVQSEAFCVVFYWPLSVFSFCFVLFCFCFIIVLFVYPYSVF